MFQVMINDRQYKIQDTAELHKWLKRGKVDKYTVITWIETGEEATVVDILEAEEEGAEERKEWRHPQDVLEEKMRYLQRRDIESFSATEYVELQQYGDELKKLDRVGEVDWAMALRFRKLLRKIGTAIVESAVNTEDIIRREGATTEAQQIEIKNRVADKMLHMMMNTKDAISEMAEKEQREGRSYSKHPNTAQPREPQRNQQTTYSQPQRHSYRTKRQESGDEQGLEHQMLDQFGGYEEEPEDNRPRYRQPQSIGMPQEEDMEKKAGCLHSPLIIILALVFFFPLGLLLVWTSPKGTFFGNSFIRLAATAMVGYFVFVSPASNTFEEILYEIKHAFQSEMEDATATKAVPAGTHIVTGRVFVENPSWAIKQPSETFDLGDKVFYLVKNVKCDKAKLVDSIYNVSKKEELFKTEYDWNVAHDQYLHSIAPDEPGKYEITIGCGDETITKKNFYIIR